MKRKGGRREKLWARQLKQATHGLLWPRNLSTARLPAAAPPPRDGRRGERHRRGHSRDAWGPG